MVQTKCWNTQKKESDQLVTQFRIIQVERNCRRLLIQPSSPSRLRELCRQAVSSGLRSLVLKSSEQTLRTPLWAGCSPACLASGWKLLAVEIIQTQWHKVVIAAKLLLIRSHDDVLGCGCVDRGKSGRYAAPFAFFPRLLLVTTVKHRRFRTESPLLWLVVFTVRGCYGERKLEGIKKNYTTQKSKLSLTPVKIMTIWGWEMMEIMALSSMEPEFHLEKLSIMDTLLSPGF